MKLYLFEDISDPENEDISDFVKKSTLTHILDHVEEWDFSFFVKKSPYSHNYLFIHIICFYKTSFLIIWVVKGFVAKNNL